MAIHLGRSSPNASRDRPERRRGRPARRRRPKPRRLPLLLGLAPGGVYPAAAVAGGAVRSYRTISPLPPATSRAAGSAVCFCGTFPGVAPAGRYPAPCLRGARTFLPPPGQPGEERPSDRLAGKIWDGAPHLSNGRCQTVAVKTAKHSARVRHQAEPLAEPRVALDRESSIEKERLEAVMSDLPTP